jgi:hypothetical protein
VGSIPTNQSPKINASFVQDPGKTQCNKSDLLMLFSAIKKIFQAKHQWLTPLILATQEAEIRRNVFEVGLGKSSQDQSRKNLTQKRAGRVS